MTTIFEQVKTALDSLNPAVPYGMDVYLSMGELPDSYIEYKLISGVAAAHADNQETHRAYRIQVSIYARGGLVSLPNVDAAMLTYGFTKGPEHQIPYDETTRHFGLAKDYFYLQKEQIND